MERAMHKRRFNDLASICKLVFPLAGCWPLDIVGHYLQYVNT